MRAALLLSLAMVPATAAFAGPAVPSEIAAATAIENAVLARTRTPANVVRDKYRHPEQTLKFFDVTPDQTIVEYSPGGGGWYTEILAPLTNGKGTLYAAQAPGKGYDALVAKFAADPATYGAVKLVPWPPEAGIPAGSVDTLLTFRNIHNMVMDGTAEANFQRFFTVLKPGGVLGIVDHRLPEGRDVALEKKSGYLKLSTVRALAEKAGFVLEAQSEINANPKDTADWPDGVWTLPPSYQLGDVDRAKYAAIGESDRMTLRFRKPK